MKLRRRGCRRPRYRPVFARRQYRRNPQSPRASPKFLRRPHLRSSVSRQHSSASASFGQPNAYLPVRKLAYAFHRLFGSGKLGRLGSAQIRVAVLRSARRGWRVVAATAPQAGWRPPSVARRCGATLARRQRLWQDRLDCIEPETDQRRPNLHLKPKDNIDDLQQLRSQGFKRLQTLTMPLSLSPLG